MWTHGSLLGSVFGACLRGSVPEGSVPFRCMAVWFDLVCLSGAAICSLPRLRRYASFSLAASAPIEEESCSWATASVVAAVWGAS